jgi:ATP-dependent DNA helicase RecG
VIRALILEICSLAPHSARALAGLLGNRDPKVLVRIHLGPMLEARELTYTIRDMPNHPDQRYLAAVLPTERGR